jgi:hypothetical protein
MFLSVGARIGYFQGDPRKLVDNIGELRPTIFFGARPRLPALPRACAGLPKMGCWSFGHAEWRQAGCMQLPI